MANTVQIKRGNNTSVNAHTGPSGEIIYNLDTGRLHAQDGSTAGGKPHALISDVDLKANADVNIIAGNGLTGGGTLAASRTLALNSTSIASLAKADTAVQSVNGKSGTAVSLVKGDVGLGNVDNTSDLAKPISTLTQTALNAKANSAITVSAGTGLTGGGNLTANRTVALNAASIASLAKADTALQAPGGTTGQVLTKNSSADFDTSWENPVGLSDGSVTDVKLVGYNDSTSPSSSKIRFQASAASGALAGAIQRPVDFKLSERLDAADFGVKADGITDDTSAMVAAFAAMEVTGRPLFLPPGTIMVDAGALSIGDGTGSTYSTKNCQAIFGSGENAYMNPTGAGIVAGTSIKARGASSSPMIDVVGGIGGLSFSGFTVDCAGVVETGINLLGVSHSDFERICVKQFKNFGIKLVGRGTTNPNSPTWCANNTFKNLSISSDANVGGSSALFLDGDLASNRDPHRNTFINVVIQINKTASVASYAAHLCFADSNTFIECDFNVVGTGLGFPLNLNNTTPGHPFPQNNFFYGCSLGGGPINVMGIADIGEHIFAGHTTADGEAIPSHPKLMGYTDKGYFFGQYGYNVSGGGGSYVSTYFSPSLQFVTNGDLGVNYSSRGGYVMSNGQKATIFFEIVTTTFTHTTASGALRITGIPFPAQGSGGGNMFVGSIQYSGINKTGYTQIAPRVEPGQQYMVLTASAPGQPAAVITASDIPSGSSVVIRGTVDVILS